VSVSIQRAAAPPHGDTPPRHEVRAAEQAAKDARRHERREHRDAARDARRQRRAAEKAVRRAATRQRMTEAGHQAAFIAPLLLVTGFAVYGQIGYIIDKIAPGDWELPFKLVLAIGAGIAIESISNYVQFRAHKVRLAGATAQAAKLSRASYLIAAGVAFINYQHFCGPNLAPTPIALMFAAFSLSSPWLWGLHTRGVEHEQRAAEGTLDRAGAVFAAERWRHFPVLTFRARRYSVMQNITDPVEAWNAFMADYRREVTTRSIERRQRRAEPRTTGLLVRWRGAKPGAAAGAPSTPQGGATGGVASGVTGGAKPPRAADGPAGLSDTGPMGRASVTSLPRRPALTPVEQTSMRDAATDWAVAQATRTGAVPGWRTIRNATDERTGALLFPGLSEYAAKAAADTAKVRLRGGTASDTARADR
jgi:F0F1-type ATP synthase assembly protein I